MPLSSSSLTSGGSLPYHTPPRHTAPLYRPYSKYVLGDEKTEKGQRGKLTLTFLDRQASMICKSLTRVLTVQAVSLRFFCCCTFTNLFLSFRTGYHLT